MFSKYIHKRIKIVFIIIIFLFILIIGKVFYIQVIDYKKLNFIHKSMMAMLKKSLDRIAEDKRDEETKMMLETYGQVVNFTDKTLIAPLIKFYNSL